MAIGNCQAVSDGPFIENFDMAAWILMDAQGAKLKAWPLSRTLQLSKGAIVANWLV